VIRVGDQIDDDSDHIAVYDTVTGRFLEIGDNHVALSRWEMMVALGYEVYSRVERLLPDDWDKEPKCRK
jgi:hypothetical protein